MIAEMLDDMLRRFEESNYQPAMIKKAGSLLQHLVEREMPANLIQTLQNQRLRDTIDYVALRSPFYKRMFREHGLRPEDIRTLADLKKIPFTTVKDIREWQDFLCVPEEKLAAVFTTSGTTGEPKRIYYTFRELLTLANLYGVAMRVVHSGRLVALIALPIGHGLWIGGAIAQRAVERAGGLPLNVGG